MSGKYPSGNWKRFGPTYSFTTKSPSSVSEP